MDVGQLTLLVRAVARLGPSADALSGPWLTDLVQLMGGAQAQDRPSLAAAEAAQRASAPEEEPPAPAPALVAAAAVRRSSPGSPTPSADPVAGRAPSPDRAGLQAEPSMLLQVADRADLDTTHATAAHATHLAAPPAGDLPPQAAPLESLFAPRRVRGILREMAVRSSDSGRIDVPRLVQTLARGSWPSPLPRQRVTRLGPAVHLLFDAGPDMLPFSADKQQLAQTALRMLGRDRLRAFDFIGTPLEGLRAQRQVRWAPMSWPARGGTLVVVGDLGIGGGDPALHGPGWRQLAEEARRRGVRSVALLPYAAARWPEAAQRFDAALSWDLDAGVQRLRQIRRHAARPAGWSR